MMGYLFIIYVFIFFLLYLFLFFRKKKRGTSSKTKTNKLTIISHKSNKINMSCYHYQHQDYRQIYIIKGTLSIYIEIKKDSFKASYLSFYHMYKPELMTQLLILIPHGAQIGQLISGTGVLSLYQQALESLYKVAEKFERYC